MDSLDFCPVLIKIIDEDLRKRYDGTYLLQVWDSKGQNVFEKVMKSKESNPHFISQILWMYGASLPTTLYSGPTTPEKMDYSGLWTWKSTTKPSPSLYRLTTVLSSTWCTSILLKPSTSQTQTRSNSSNWMTLNKRARSSFLSTRSVRFQPKTTSYMVFLLMRTPKKWNQSSQLWRQLTTSLISAVSISLIQTQIPLTTRLSRSVSMLNVRFQEIPLTRYRILYDKAPSLQ